MIKPAGQLLDELPRHPRGGFSALGEAERNRLVEAAKCPTRSISRDSGAAVALFAEADRKAQAHRELMAWVDQNGGDRADFWQPKQRTEDAGPAPFNAEHFFETGEVRANPHERQGGEGRAFTVVSEREWSGEFRVRTAVDMCSGAPPEQSGPRITHNLSEAGARKIADSCLFMHLKNNGYRTFLTLTMDAPGRSRVEIRESEGRCTEIEWKDGAAVPLVEWREAGRDMTFSTIQKEVSRFFDAANKMRQRGWQAAKSYPWGQVKCYERDGQPVGEAPSEIIGVRGYLEDKKITVQRLPVRYCWVVENPMNERGQRNPHIHILMDWRVKFSAFPSWAHRLESLWGQGFAHLEKIKDSELAGAYMAKAAGYLSKAAGESDQGPVRGNRYGISQPARAPEWACIGRYEMSIMGHLITDVHDYFSHCYGAQFARRTSLKAKLDETPKSETKTRLKIGRALGKVRATLNELPAIASKHQIVIKGLDRFREFWRWAVADNDQVETEWLPAKPAEDAWNPDAPKPVGNWLHEFQHRMHARRFGRRWSGLNVKTYAQWVSQEPAADNDPTEAPPWWSGWFEWERAGLAA